MAERKRSKLVEILLSEGAVTPTQLDKAKAGIRTDCEVQSLIGMGVLSDLRVMGYLIKNLRIPYVMISNYNVNPEVLALLPEEYCCLKCVLPLEKLGVYLTLAMVDPLDEAVIEEVSDMTKLTVKPILCSAREFADVTRAVWKEAFARKRG